MIFSTYREIEPLPQGFPESRRIRPQVLRVGAPRDLADATLYPRKRKKVPFDSLCPTTVKLANPREKVRRALGLSKFGPSLLDWDRTTGQNPIPAARTPSTASALSDRGSATSDTNFDRQSRTLSEQNMSHRNSLSESPRIADVSPTRRQSMISVVETEKPVAAGNGVSVSINLAEPVLFLQGFDSSDFEYRNTAMLRGTLRLRVTKSAKLKAVTLRFKGRAETQWPEGQQSSPFQLHI